MIDKKVAFIGLLMGLTTLGVADTSTEVTEEQIAKALEGVNSLTILKEGESKVIYESEAMVLEADRPKVKKNSPKTVAKVKVKRAVHRKPVHVQTHVEPVYQEVSVDMDNLPMATTYSMETDLSEITE